jgi:pSer/pThr/pTyr-binding forkhead associated (FHA) protein
MVRKCQLRGHSGPVLNQVVCLGERDITLGRDLANDVVIADSEVSRTHARVSWESDGHTVRDLKSTNGTWLNGRPVSQGTRLALGDLLTLGKTSIFVYELVPESELDTSREQGSDDDLIESTMAMPAFPEAALEARRLIKPKAPEPAAPPPAVAIPLETELSPGRSFHQRYLAHLQDGNLEGLLSQYEPDATLLSIDRGITGTDGIGQFFRQYFGGLGRLKAKPTGKYVEGQDSILCETRLETPDSVALIQDVFVLRDGKATHHFTCTLSVSPRLS